MKNGPTNVVVLAVVVALFISLYALWSVRSSLSHQLSELQGSVDTLQSEVQEVRATVGVIGQRLDAFTIPSGKLPEQPVVEGGTAPGVDVEQPGDGAEEYNEEPVDIVLAIAADGSLTLDGRAVSRDGLEAELKRLMQARPAMHLIVRADKSVPQVEVQRCIDAAGEAHIYNVEFATTPGETAPEGADREVRGE